MALCVHVRVRARGEGHTLISTQQPNRGTCADIARSSDFELNLDDFAEALAGPSSADVSGSKSTLQRTWCWLLDP